MDRPEWIGAAIDRGKTGLGALRSVPSRLRQSSDEAEETEAPDKAEATEATEKSVAVEAIPSGEKSVAVEAMPSGEETESGPGVGTRIGQLASRVRERPGLAIGFAVLVLLVIVWIAWAIHVGSTNGGSAAVGVLITWPLLFFLAASLALLVIGTTRMVRRLQPTTESGAEALAEEPESDPNPSDEDEEEEKTQKKGKAEDAESEGEKSEDDAKDEKPEAAKPAGKAKS